MEFDLGVILSLSTGRCLTNPTAIREASDYIYSEYYNSFLGVEQTEQLTSQYILNLYPQLQGIGEFEEFKTWEDVNQFIDAQKLIYGNKLIIKPMTEEISFELTSQICGKAK